MLWNTVTEGVGKYKEFIVPEGKKICAVNMRDKSDSWQNYSIKIDFGDSTSYVADKQTDLYAKHIARDISFVRHVIAAI